MARLSLPGRKKATKALLRAVQAGFRKVATVGSIKKEQPLTLSREELHRRIFERLQQLNLLSDEESKHAP